MILILTLAILAACATAPRDRPGGAGLERARALERAGQYQRAAELYVQLAEGAAEADQANYLLRAAAMYLQADQPARVQAVLERIARGQLTGSGALRYDLTAAELALQRASPGRALGYLDWPPAEIPAAFRVRFHQLRARALAGEGQTIEAARERVALSQWLDTPELVASNRETLFNTLLRLSPAKMQQTLQSLPRGDVLRGWLALAHLIKTRMFEGEPMADALARWRRAYPNHPAGDVLAARIVTRYQESFQYPQRIALLLPLTGQYAFAAEAIRNGFFMAYYSDTGERPAVRVYDTRGTAQGALRAYRQAVFEGAGWIIGPLAKQAVTRVLSESRRLIPILALNYPEQVAAPRSGRQPGGRTADHGAASGAPAYIFGLLPEQEARQTAAKMLADGHRRALVLVPRNEWGERMMQAFVERFTEMGGYISDVARFDPNEADHSQVIQRLLGLSAGAQRAQRLEQALGRQLAYIPHPRDDADALFLAAHPRQARLIKPQLRFYQAINLPVYGTSHLYAGVPQPEDDVDLNGIIFPDAPWILGVAQKGPPREEILPHFPAAGAEAGRLYALGADAYRVIPYLAWLADHPGEHYPGLSGRLSVDAAGRLHRRLAWARFQNGVPVVVDQPLPPLMPRRTANTGAY